MNDYLMHVGVAHDEEPPGRGSGRYPYGSGNRPHQHDWDLKARYEKLRSFIDPETGKPYTEKEIAAQMGYTKEEWDKEKKEWVQGGHIAKLRAEKEIATANVNSDKYEEVMWYYNHIDPKTGKPYTRAEVARLMGINESSVRSIENTKTSAADNQLFRAANELKSISEEKGFIDISKGAELSLGVSPDRLNTVVEVLKKEGYTVQNISIPQATNPNRLTTMSVLCPPGMEGEAFKHRFEVKSIEDISGIDNVATLKGWQDPVKVDLNRVKILYDEDGGTAKDGMIEIRAKLDSQGNPIPACEDLSLGNARYGQVRIAVDCGEEGIRYIKGMAVYNPDLPKGMDIRVNSNKSKEDGVKKALKDYESDSPNPFGASVVQTYVRDKDGKIFIDPSTGKPKLSAIQFVGTPTDDDHDMHVEGSWGNWNRNLPAQFLAKQSLPLVQQQLKLKTLNVESEYKDILSLTNPTVKKKMLLDFADQCDAAAVDLKAAPLPGQGVHVILQSNTLKDNEIFAPNYANGTVVALVRFPHTGPFEIPVCTVNNHDKESINQIGKNAKDAVCVSSNTASKLSGADFDGDTAIVIPMTRKNSQGGFDKFVNIKATDQLPGMQNFNPTAEYGEKKFQGVKYHKMTEQEKGREMGVVSNLITDMYAKGCEDPDHLARAVKYSMVVIDAEKHNLNYKQAAKDYRIDELKDIYQKNPDGSHGASSLISRSKSPKEIPIRSERFNINKETGEKEYFAPKKTTKNERSRVKAEAPEDYRWIDESGKAHKSKYFKDENGKDIYATVGGKVKQDETGNYYYDRGTGKDAKDIWVNTGKTIPITQKIAWMDKAKDAKELLSDNPNAIEKTYADYANHMKALGNKARKEYQRINSDPKEKAKNKINPSAKKEYAAEVESLEQKLIEAKKNKPRERQAQLLCNSRINAALADDPDRYSSQEERRKLRGIMLKQARIDCGAQKSRVTFTDREWEAIQNHAIGETKLLELLDNSDSTEYVSRSLPRESRITPAKKSLVQAYYKAGYTYEQIAAITNVPQGSISGIVG